LTIKFNLIKIPIQKNAIIPAGRVNYLREISEVGKRYKGQTEEKVEKIDDLKAITFNALYEVKNLMF
jgi:hypothetical protein